MGINISSLGIKYRNLGTKNLGEGIKNCILITYGIKIILIIFKYVNVMY